MTPTPQTVDNCPSQGWGFSLKGIRPKGRCKRCGGPFRWDKSNKKEGFICPEHGTSPKRYQIDFSCQGHRIRRETTFAGKALHSFADAHSLLGQAEREIDNKTFDISKWVSKERREFKFEVLIKKWLEERTGISPGYLNQLTSYVNCHFINGFKGLDVRDIRKAHAKDFFKSLPLAAPTKKTMLSVLVAFFHWLKEEEELIPALPNFPKITAPKYTPTIVTREVQLQLLTVVPERHKPIFTWLIYQACRPSEARALQWRDIEGEMVTYRRTWSQTVLKESPKDGEPRANWIFPESIEALPPRRFPKDFVFIHRLGKQHRHYSHMYLISIYRDALKRLNAQRASQSLMEINCKLYEFTKHSTGTHLHNEGVPLEVLQEHFGHSDLSTTKIYAKLRPVDAMKRVVTSIEKARSGDRQVTENQDISD